MQKLHLYAVKLNILKPMRNLLILGLTWLGLVLSQSLPDGSELLLTDLESQVIVGHGKVFAGQVYLKLSDEAGEFFLYVVSPDGNVATHHGEAKEELLGVFAEDGELIDLSEVLASRGVELLIQRVEEFADETSSDDALLETPKP
jgi:hypothetical protein